MFINIHEIAIPKLISLAFLNIITLDRQQWKQVKNYLEYVLFSLFPDPELNQEPEIQYLGYMIPDPDLSSSSTMPNCSHIDRLDYCLMWIFISRRRCVLKIHTRERSTFNNQTSVRAPLFYDSISHILEGQMKGI